MRFYILSVIIVILLALKPDYLKRKDKNTYPRKRALCGCVDCIKFEEVNSKIRIFKP